MNSERMQV